MANQQAASAPSLSTFDWKQAKWGAALCRVPALMLCLGLALWLDELQGGVVAAGAALSVGLVGNRRLAGSSFLAMVVTTLIMASSASLGTLVGESLWLGPIVTALWGLGFAFLTIHDDDSGWIAMQGVICLVIAQAFPAHGLHAMERGLAVIVGGSMQIAVLGLIRWIEHLVPTRAGEAAVKEAPPAPVTYRWDELWLSFQSFSPAWRYALRVALTLIVAVELARRLNIQNGYWLPMTTLIILKPDFYRTYSGAIQRVAGTFLGVTVASLIAHLFHPGLAALVTLVAIFSFGCFTFLKVNPIPFSASLTAYVVFLISTTGLPETTITGHRLVLTALGSALALISRFIGRHSIVGLFGKRVELK
jgi:uncharacterized membrane protein YccC